MNREFLLIAQRIQALAQTGLHFGSGVYDLERYDELYSLSCSMLSHLTGITLEEIQAKFILEPAYATPKVDVRAVVINGGKLLLVKEAADGKWSLPGGWADVGYTPKEVAEKEVREETGLEVRAGRLLAVFDKKMHDHPPYLEYSYKICILCEYLQGELRGSVETTEVGFFLPNALPDLSTERITAKQIEYLLARVANPAIETWID